MAVLIYRRTQMSPYGPHRLSPTPDRETVGPVPNPLHTGVGQTRTIGRADTQLVL